MGIPEQPRELKVGVSQLDLFTSQNLPSKFFSEEFSEGLEIQRYGDAFLRLSFFFIIIIYV